MKPEDLATVAALVTQQLQSGTPAASAPATVPAPWIGEAKAARAAKPAPVAKDTSERKAPRPLLTETLIVQPKLGGRDFEPFKVVHIHNGASGRFYRGVKLDARYLTAVRAFKGGV